MKAWGVWLIAIGILVALGSLALSTTIETSVPSPLGYGITTSSKVHNLGLLQRQLMVFLAGGLLAVSGVALLAAGLIQEGSRRGGQAANDRPETSHLTNPGPATHAFRFEPRSPEELAAIRERERKETRWILAIAGAIMALIVVAVLLKGTDSSGDSVAAIERNAAALADNLELQADNLEVSADNLAEELQ